MRLSIVLFTALFFLGACNSGARVEEGQTEENKSLTGVFGKEFPAGDAVDASELTSLFGESNKVEIKLKGRITECCQHSGCWMNIDIGGGKTMQVLFKDAEFTIPIESAGKQAIIKGIAYREQVEVDELRAMAREDGKSEPEISLIIEPAWEYSFIAEGVIIQ